MTSYSIVVLNKIFEFCIKKLCNKNIKRQEFLKVGIFLYGMLKNEYFNGF